MLAMLLPAMRLCFMPPLRYDAIEAPLMLFFAADVYISLLMLVADDDIDMLMPFSLSLSLMPPPLRRQLSACRFARRLRFAFVADALDMLPPLYADAISIETLLYLLAGSR